VIVRPARAEAGHEARESGQRHGIGKAQRQLGDRAVRWVARVVIALREEVEQVISVGRIDGEGGDASHHHDGGGGFDRCDNQDR
jgi:hypothetical protein